MQFPEDADSLETQEWLDSLASVVQKAGRSRGIHLLRALSAHARNLGVKADLATYSAYRNTLRSLSKRYIRETWHSKNA